MPASRMILGAVVGVTLLLPASEATAQVTRQRVDTAFAFDKGGSVALSLVSGEVRVVAGTTNEIRISASLERGRLETAFSRGRVSIEAHSVAGRLGAARYELTVPVGTRVRVGSVSGDISIRGTEEEVLAHTVSGEVDVEGAMRVVDIGSVSGDVTLRRLAGRIEINAVNGDVRVDGASGALVVNTVSGRVDIRGGRLSELRMESVSADLAYDGTFARDGTYRLNTHSGAIDFALPANAGASLELETWSGNISSDFPLTLQPDDAIGRRRRRMQFTLGSGGSRITAESFSGNITIRRLPARPQE